MSQVSETPPPSSPPPTMSPTALHRWRQRIAGALLLVGGIVLLASYFLPWSSGSQVPGLDICPTCTPKVFTTSAWSLINPLAVHWDSIFLAVTRGEFSPLLAYAIATFLQLVVPALLMFLGWRLLVRTTSMRLHWQVLIVLYSVAELLVARALLDITTWFSLVDRYPAIGFYLAYGAILGFLVAGLLMPHARRHRRPPAESLAS